MYTLHDRACIYINCGDVEIVNVHIVIVFCICHGAPEGFFNHDGSCLVGIAQNGDCFSRFLTADKVSYDADLAGRNADIS